MVVILQSLKDLPNFKNGIRINENCNCSINKAYIIVAFNYLYGTAGSVYFAQKAQDQVVYIEGDSRQAECVSRLCDYVPEETEGQRFCELQIPEQVWAEKEFLYLQVQGIRFF